MTQVSQTYRVVHLATTDVGGGAAIASYRLHQGLRRLGVDSQMVVAQKLTDDPYVHGASTLIGKLWARVAHHIDQLPRRLLKTPNTSLLSPSWVPSNAVKRALAMKPDIVNLHWVQNAFVHPSSLWLLNNMPTVWTLHDMWVFCGAEHYVGSDERYIHGYTRSNRPAAERGLDINRWTWRRKMRVLPHLRRLAIVADSVWLGECAAKSLMLQGRRIVPINYGVDTDIFKPVPKDTARYILNIPHDAVVVLFGAINAASDKRKGIDLLAAALQHLTKILAQKQSITSYVFGTSSLHQELDFGVPVQCLGSITDSIALAVVYSAADVMVVPSREEAFGQTALEALSCGVPVVAFRIGGLVDTVRHRYNGYLAEPFSTEDLAQGIEFVIENNQRHAMLSQNARKTVLERFTLEHQAQQYMQIYTDLLGSS